MYNVVIFTDVISSIASVPAIGAYKLAHMLRKNGYSCLVVNHFSDYTSQELKDLLDIVISNTTVLVGFSTTFLANINIEFKPGEPVHFPELPSNTVFPHGVEVESEIINYIRQKNPAIKIAAGGTKVHPNYANKNIDYVCLGYSEKSVVNLVDHLSQKVPLKNAMRNVFGVCVIDDKFATEYDFKNEDMCWLPEDIVNHKTLPIEIARGCIFKCKFCSYPMNGKQNLDFVKCNDCLREELQSNYDKFGVENYFMVDDTFNDHIQKLQNMRDVVQSLSFRPKFWGYHRLDLICTRPETIDLLYDIGVRAMFFGIETLNHQAGKVIGKGHDRNKQIKMIQHIRNKYPDITMHGSFIIGLPYESVASIEQTHNQLLSQEIPLNSWQVQALNIRKVSLNSYHSDIEKNYQSYGYTDLGSEGMQSINWANEYMTYQQAQQIAIDFEARSEASDIMYVSGVTAMTVATMGYPALNFEKNKNTKFRDFKFNLIEKKLRKDFVTAHKAQLLDIVKQKIN